MTIISDFIWANAQKQEKKIKTGTLAGTSLVNGL